MSKNIFCFKVYFVLMLVQPLHLMVAFEGVSLPAPRWAPVDSECVRMCRYGPSVQCRLTPLCPDQSSLSLDELVEGLTCSVTIGAVGSVSAVTSSMSPGLPPSCTTFFCVQWLFRGTTI